MFKQFCFLLLASIAINANAQTGVEKDTAWKKVYRATPEVVFDLVHTKLECSFDFEQSYLNGKVWITAKPHFYPNNKITLDAKAMDIAGVWIMNGASKKKLEFEYDALELVINLDRTYKAAEKITLYIEYTAKPDEYNGAGSAAITDAKGLYFINPKGEDKDKPTAIWTQGETEGTSVWCPTIDRPGQKTTNEFYITVPQKYVTLSNGLKLSEKKNANGTRTDYWKMDLPHAPYLFFIGVGDLAIIKDKPYKGKEVSYYVEKDQAKYAMGVFGNTPEMIKFFSEKLGVDYPWQKYSQIVGRDYVSGAMENTTAVIHQESAYQDDRELADGNIWDETIAHELFHHWFGDLVTAESWSNLTVNESFANYSEYLWDEYKYGKDYADAHNFSDMQGYLFGPGNSEKHLARFHYNNKEDMFDGVSYNKGGRILHMLRKYLGDDAFFKSLQNYLTTNKFKTGEAHQLRLAFEEVSGKDLSWFFNQWYFGAGHPKLEISTAYTADKEELTVTLNQTQTSGKVFKLPVDIDVYVGKNKKRETVWLEEKEQTFTFNYGSKPDLVDVDGDRILLVEKKELTKTAEEYQVQYEKNANYLARREAIDYFAKNGKADDLKFALSDKFAGLRSYTVSKISALSNKADFVENVFDKAVTEKDNKTKAAMLSFLAKTKDAKYKELFSSNVSNKSYSIAGAALEGLIGLDKEGAYDLAKKYGVGTKGALRAASNKVIMEAAKEADFELLSGNVAKAPLTQEGFQGMATFGTYLSKLKNIALIKKGVEAMATFRNKIPSEFHKQVNPQFIQFLTPAIKVHGDELKTFVEGIFK